VEGWSLDAQKKSFEEFCQAKGWAIASFYADEGKSAWTDSISKRPGFRRVLEDAKADEFDVVVTHTLDRFSRNLWVLLDSVWTVTTHVSNILNKISAANRTEAATYAVLRGLVEPLLGGKG